MTLRRRRRKDDTQRRQSRISDGKGSIPKVLRTTRLGLRLSQQELAAKLGMRQRQISDLERGAVDARLSTIQDVARALDLELMLIPRQLISTVEAMQRAGREGDNRPLYALDHEDDEDGPSRSHVEVGDTSSLTRDAEGKPRSTNGKPS
jgi:transcriptional regulator with XRE-family HTH domain